MRVVATLIGVTSLVLAAMGAAAEDVPFVDGKMWRESAPILKRAYLIGISNLMSAEYAYQREFGPPPDRQTTVQRLYEEIDDVTLNGAIDRIDQWYEAHPEQLGTTVLEVIWLDMVRPNLPPSRRYEPGEARPEGAR